jgi:DNA-binding LytR/AlgR family response regulator
MKIVICEDNHTQSEFLANMVREWARQNKIMLDVDIYHSAEAFLFSMPEKVPADILLLDIQMDDMTGVDLAKKLRRENNDVIIIFLTAIKEYVFEGYEVDALNYLLKPIDKHSLFTSLGKAKVKIENQASSYLLLNKTKVSQKDITYLEALSHYIHVYTVDGMHKVKCSMSQMLKELDNTIFVQCHRSYIVGLRHISSILKSEVVLEDGGRVPVSRAKYKDVNKAFINFYKR